jgi:lysophospholipid acyltransferase (LPLAT)-like uncharacterized protein
MTVNNQRISDRKLTLTEKITLFAVPLIIAITQKIYGITLRKRNIGSEFPEKLHKEGKPFIYAIWHTNVFLSPYFLRNQSVHVLISASRDGELIHRVVRFFNNFSIRGSTSRGGIGALKSVITVLRKGSSVAITPDGPKGPAFKVQDGILFAAARSGAPIIPFHYEADRQWVFEKAWDKHRIPKPFSKVICSYGDPVYIPEDLEAETLDAERGRLENLLLMNMGKAKSALND